MSLNVHAVDLPMRPPPYLGRNLHQATSTGHLIIPEVSISELAAPRQRTYWNVSRLPNETTADILPNSVAERASFSVYDEERCQTHPS